MKKIGFFLCVILIASGCTSTSSGTMQCTNSTQQEQITSTVTMNFTYENDIVIKQENETEIVATTVDAYDQIMAVVSSSQLIFNEISGTTYEATSTDETKTIKEKVTIDFKVISEVEKQKVLSYAGSDDMNVNDIKEALQAQSFTCAK